MKNMLIADSGSTKTEWCLITENKRQIVFTQGLSPYFLNQNEIEQVLKNELLTGLHIMPDTIHFYGTGCASDENCHILKQCLSNVLRSEKIEVTHDLMAAARATCGDKAGIVSILGTGSNSCFYDGNKIVNNSPGLGYILGDEGSGAYLGKMVLQYYLYQTFEPELEEMFLEKYKLTKQEILNAVYKKQHPNRFLANFAHFLSENRGHFMIENIIEDGLNDFFFVHLCKFTQSWTYPVNFIGSIAYEFKDVILSLCHSYEFEPGIIEKSPMNALVDYHLKYN